MGLKSKIKLSNCTIRLFSTTSSRSFKKPGDPGYYESEEQRYHRVAWEWIDINARDRWDVIIQSQLDQFPDAAYQAVDRAVDLVREEFPQYSTDTIFDYFMSYIAASSAREIPDFPEVPTDSPYESSQESPHEESPQESPHEEDGKSLPSSGQKRKRDESDEGERPKKSQNWQG